MLSKIEKSIRENFPGPGNRKIRETLRRCEVKADANALLHTVAFTASGKASLADVVFNLPEKLDNRGS